MPRCHHLGSSIKIVTARDTDTLEPMSTELELVVIWQRHLGTGRESAHWFDTVLGMHRAPGRYYHDVRHVTWVVRHITAISSRHGASDEGAIVAAGFFHDAVYDPTRTDNETESAALADRALIEIGWQAPRRDAVAAMVIATADHDVDAADADTQVLLAADLAVLASEPARYGDYTIAVRKEYGHVSDDVWRVGRAAVLHSLLDRPRLFAPRLQLGEWERRARANITSELAQLSSPS
jgi:predicted metal-dependent HD superfamily phosphohydrolase